MLACTVVAGEGFGQRLLEVLVDDLGRHSSHSSLFEVADLRLQHGRVAGPKVRGFLQGECSFQTHGVPPLGLDLVGLGLGGYLLRLGGPNVWGTDVGEVGLDFFLKTFSGPHLPHLMLGLALATGSPVLPFVPALPLGG